MYLSSVFSNATVKDIFDEIAWHVSVSPGLTLLIKAALLEGGGERVDAEGQEIARAAHAKWLAEELRERTKLQAIVQDVSGLAAPLSTAMGFTASGMRLHGDCKGVRKTLFKGALRVGGEEDRQRRRSWHELPFGWGQMDPNDEASEGCMLTWRPESTNVSR